MTRPLFCFCAAFALGCIASQYFLAPALWLPAAGIVLAAFGIYMGVESWDEDDPQPEPEPREDGGHEAD